MTEEAVWVIRLVVMAAGQATRMGTDKLALAWQETTVLGYVIQEALQALAEFGHESELVVVARKPLAAYLLPSAESLFQWMRARWRLLPAPVPQAQTIRTGLEDIGQNIIGIGFLPGDQVGVNRAGLHRLLNHFADTEPDVLIPSAGTVSGSPVFFHRKLIPSLSSLEGEQGGKTVLKNFQGKIGSYQVESDFFTDLDTPEEYNRLTRK